jgi:hypothetical protein
MHCCSLTDREATAQCEQAHAPGHGTNLLDALAKVDQLKVKVDELAVLRQPVVRQQPVTKHAVHGKYGLLSVLFVLGEVANATDFNQLCITLLTSPFCSISSIE